MLPLAHQRAALDEIVRRARPFFAGDWRNLPVIPRWPSLMVGPTGTGKTAVASMAAAALSKEIPGAQSVSTLVIATPTWIPLGANNRGTKETLRTIAAHIARNDRTILVLDELDKITSGPGGASGGNGQAIAGDTWQSYIRAELYSTVLDCRWPVGLTLSALDDEDPDITIDELSRKLRDTVFVIGVGTFQNWFDSVGSRRPMGFRAGIDPPNDELTAEIIAEKLPRELSNRFNGNLIRVPELTPDDYRRVAQEVEKQLPLRMRTAFRAEVTRLLPAAIAAKKGVRFIQEVMLATLISLPPQPGKISELVELGIFQTTDIEPCTL